MTDIHNQQTITPFVKSPYIGSTGVDVVAGGGGGSGTPGSKWLSGATAPLQTLGAVGDWFVNYTNGNVYEKTATLVWTLRMNIVGSQGPTGAAGATGAPGPTGAQGVAGAAGQGVPTGGTAGQVLAKIDGTNYNTQWVTPSSGGGGTVTGNFVPTDQFPVTFGVQLTGNTAATASTTVPVATVRAPFAFTLTEVRAWASASDGTNILIDIESTIGGTAQSLLGNRILIDANELSSLDAVTQPTIVNASIASDQELRFFVDQVGAGARNLMVWLLGRRVLTLTPTAPNSPTWLNPVPGNNTATVYWTVPAANNSPITSYNVEYKRAIDSTWIAYTGSITSGVFANVGENRSAAITGLTAGTLYDVRVRAVNAVGPSGWSATQFTTTGAPSVPGAPTALSGTPSPAQIALSWTAPASNGGSVISDYVVEFKLTSAGTWSTFNDGISSATTATVTGLTASTSYDFRVSAVNIAGTGPVSAVYTISTSAPVGGVPNAPTGLLVDSGASGGNFFNGGGTISWTAPVGGGTVVDYVVEAKLNSEAASQWRRFTTRPTATSFGFNVSFGWTFFYGGTTNAAFGSGGGTQHDFRVAASNTNGLSAWVSGTWANQDAGG